MSTFTRSQLFKTVRLVEIEGKIDEFDSNEKTQPILDNLVRKGVIIDLGFKFKFIPQPCPICGIPLKRAVIVDVDDETSEIRLFCHSCLWSEKMPR